MNPKVFISYSWSDPAHQEQIKNWAERMVADGIDVILDIYDLKEGHDKYAFMERMVADTSVTHVLVICDKQYAEKADSRKSGVGTESQIISQEVYNKVEQSKFIPIVCEFSDDGTPFLPTFLKSRIWINFSSPQAENENWEQLVRLLFGKPQHAKPKLGKPPAYITSDVSTPTIEASVKFNTLKQAILNDKKGITMYRRDFLEACYSYIDALRVRKQPDLEKLGEKVFEDAGKLKQIRNLLVDWVLVESESSDQNVYSEIIIEVLEKLRELKSRPDEITSWNDAWFEAHSVFVYETFLYFIAALLRNLSFQVLHEIYSSHYLMPKANRYGDEPFEKFDVFYGHSGTLQSVLAPEGRRLHSPAAELLKRQADREDLPFSSLIQAELLTLLMSFITPDTHWYPQTLHYASNSAGYPFFVRAAQHKHFAKLAIITGISSADELRTKVVEGKERINVKGWHSFHFGGNFDTSMNLAKLDTIK